MRITTNDGKTIIKYEIIKTEEAYKYNRLQEILDFRRKVFMSGCPKEYQNLVDIPEWFFITRYREELDENHETLLSLLDSRNRVVLMDKGAPYTKNGSNNSYSSYNFTSNEYVGFTAMEGSESGVLLLFPKVYDEDIAYLSQFMAVDMNKRKTLPKTALNREELYKYDDNFINMMMSEEFLIPVTGIIKEGITGEKEGVLVRDVKSEPGNQAKWLPIHTDASGLKLVRLSEVEDLTYRIFLLGDMVDYDSNRCIVTAVQFSDKLSSVENHLLHLVNVKTKSEFRVSMIEVKPI